jgi:hypothetical protein
VSDEADDTTPETSEVSDTDQPTEEEVRARLENLSGALAALDDESIRRAVAALSETNRAELAGQLQLPKPTMHLGGALPGLLRRKLRAAPPERQLTAGFTLCEGANDETVRALGSRHEDPSRDDLLEVLPPIIDEYGAPLVTALVAAYAASDAPCRAVMAELLDTDERLAIGPPVADTVEAPQSHRGDEVTPLTEAEKAARREERRLAKAARREAAAHERVAREAAHAARRAAQRKAKKH